MQSTLSANTNWIKCAPSSHIDLAALIEEKAKSRILNRQYRADEVSYVAKVNFCPIKGRLQVSEQELNTLRRLCQAWNIEIRPMLIQSHRPIIGPAIVAVKKIIFPILRVLMKDFVTQQRDFNAAAIGMLGTLLSERVNIEPDSKSK